MAKKKTGTREWSEKSINFVKDGCSHNCRYCYSRYDAVERYKKIKEEDWGKETVNEKAVNTKYTKYSGVCMLPTVHDITPKILDSAIKVLDSLLKAGNKVLIVSKPHMECIVKICDTFEDYEEQILFRFSIGAMDDTVLSYWEPDAPKFNQRLNCLKYAFAEGYQTSISSEPLLDPPYVKELFDTLKPYVTDSIWIGPLNKIDQRVKIVTEEDAKQVAWIKEHQTPEWIKFVYNEVGSEPLVRWKDAYKEELEKLGIL